MNRGDRSFFDVGAHQDCALLDLLLPALGLAALESRLPQRPCNASGHVPGRLAKPGRQRAVCHDRPDSGKD